MQTIFREYRDVIVFFLGWPSLVGASFAAVASVLRRRHGTRALIAVTVGAMVVAVVLAMRLDVLDAPLAIPAIPALLVAAGVLEWRARRAAQSELWRHVLWGTAAFVILAALGEGAILAGCTMCGL
jgi:hypothetical protein